MNVYDQKFFIAFGIFCVVCLAINAVIRLTPIIVRWVKNEEVKKKQKIKIIILCSVVAVLVFTLWFIFSDTGKMLRYVVPLNLRYEYSAEYGSSDEETLESIRKLASWYYDSYEDIDSHCDEYGTIFKNYWRTVKASNNRIKYTTFKMLEGKSSRFKKQLDEEAVSELKAICDANNGNLDVDSIYEALSIENRLYTIGKCLNANGAYFVYYENLPMVRDKINEEYLKAYTMLIGEAIWEDIGKILENLHGYTEGLVGSVSDYEYSQACKIWITCNAFIKFTNTYEKMWNDKLTFRDLLTKADRAAKTIFNRKRAEVEKEEQNSKPSGRPYSGGYYWYGDIYDVEDYDDPDDFADEWEDEFDDWDDAYEYWEENHR